MFATTVTEVATTVPIELGTLEASAFVGLAALLAAARIGRRVAERTRTPRVATHR